MGKNAFLPIHGNFLLAIYFGEAVYTQKVASQWETAICLLVKRPVQPHLFHEGRKQATTKFSFSLRTWIWFLEIQLLESTPTWRNKWIGIILTKNKRTQIRLLSDVNFRRGRGSPSHPRILRSQVTGERLAGTNSSWDSCLLHRLS